MYHLRKNKFHEWSSAPVVLPRSLVLLVLMFVIVLTIGAYARYKADKMNPIRYSPCTCEGSGTNPTFL